MIFWKEENVPCSEQFGDVYYSGQDGLFESRHVFLGGNRLMERFASLGKREVFHVAETGFGTGLNFLAVWQAFEASGSCGSLRFSSVEKFPLRREEMHRAHKNWPELAGYSDFLCAAWSGEKLPEEGHASFCGGQVGLSVSFCDVLADGFSPKQVDAWFLDGFAPAKNPQMWQAGVFQKMASGSPKNTTLATFTVARIVREGLQNAGFDVQKVLGYGKKREMLIGHKK